MVNPIHIASIYSAFANDGNMIKPYLEFKEEASPTILVENAFSKDAANEIKNDLIQVVENPEGTAKDMRINGTTIAGKTGTAEIKQSQSDTTGTELGWFTVMTIDEKQPILMTTVVEDVKNRGGSGYVVEHTKAPLDLYLPQVSD